MIFGADALDVCFEMILSRKSAVRLGDRDSGHRFVPVFAVKTLQHRPGDTIVDEHARNKRDKKNL